MKPADVVNWLVAVQSQDYAGAKWALGLRLQNMHDGDLEHIFNAGMCTLAMNGEFFSHRAGAGNRRDWL